MRAFIAIPIPALLVEYVDNLRKQLNMVNPDVKWVENENYHLTLKFLGDIDQNLKQSISRKLLLASQSSPPFLLSIKGLGFFPNKTRPRVIWLGVEGEVDRADVLGQRIDACLLPLGFEPEKRRSFHLTIGRIRSETGVHELLRQSAAIGKEVVTEPFLVKEFKLMESQLSSKGPTYNTIDTFGLNG